MHQKIRRACSSIVRRFPVYRVLPWKDLRLYAEVFYLSSRAPVDKVCDRVRKAGPISTTRLSLLRLLSRSAFLAGQDDIVEEAIERAIAVYPERAEVWLDKADFETFVRGPQSALKYVEKAALLNPQLEGAFSRLVRLHFLAGNTATAEREGIAALAKFPRSSQVLWAVCKACSNVAQFEEIENRWRSTLRRPADFVRNVRQVAHAASRVELFEKAADLYLEASLLVVGGHSKAAPVTEKSLAGKGGLSAIRDIAGALNDAGVPFFLAAGTALGVVRDGRPLDHDQDIDVGVFEEHWDKEALLKIFADHPSFQMHAVHQKTPKVGVVHRGGANIDIFKFYREAGRVWHDGVFVRWQNSEFTLRPLTVSGASVFLPSPEDRYLTENYGNWRIPDKSFDAFLDGPNVEVIWEEYHQLHRVRRAFKRLMQGDQAAARDDFIKAGRIVEIAPHGKTLLSSL